MTVKVRGYILLQEITLHMVKGQGKAPINIPDRKIKHIHSVLYVARLENNFLFVSQIKKQHFKEEFVQRQMPQKEQNKPLQGSVSRC